jgi:hypothetical protein
MVKSSLGWCYIVLNFSLSLSPFSGIIAIRDCYKLLKLALEACFSNSLGVLIVSSLNFLEEEGPPRLNFV